MQNTCDLLITNAKAVIPNVGILDTDILIEDEKIKELKKISSSSNIAYSRLIDAKQKYVLPGLIDPHVHYGVFSPIDQAAKSESKSAAIGGVTTIMRMLRIFDPYEHKIGEHLRASMNSHFVDYCIHASILNPIQVEEIHYLAKLGITSFKLYMNLGATDNRILMDMNPYENKYIPKNVIVSDKLCYDVLQRCSLLRGSTVLVHAEDHDICSSLIDESKQKYYSNIFDDSVLDKKGNGRESITNSNPLRIWSECRPTKSEIMAVKKIMSMGRQFGSKLYFVHIGSNDALDTILSEKQLGHCNTYIETCPHYLTHSINYNDLKGKVVPPLRTKNDVASLWSAIKNGMIDTIGTDHVANTLNLKYGEKNDVWTALAGFPGIATMLPVLLHYGVHLRNLSMLRLAELTSYNSSKIFGMFPKKGTILKGSDADLVIVDLDLTQKVNSKILGSFSDYSIYEGYELKGWPVYTISRGQVIMENGSVSNKYMGHGKFVKKIF